MTQTQMFARLGAPLKNSRWSMGSVREADGALFLRVWQDGSRRINGKRYIRLSDELPPEDDVGATERLEHVKLAEAGQPCYLIMCQPEDPKAEPRKVQSFNRREVFVGGEVIVEDNAYWVELEGRVPFEEAIL